MRFELQNLQNEISPLCEVHGAELVALEWLQGPGRGILRLYIDRPGGDPRSLEAGGDPRSLEAGGDPRSLDTTISGRPSGTSAELCAQVSRDVGALLDTLDLIEGAYDLEVGSPGLERPVQKRADFDRFKGVSARISTHRVVLGQRTFEGTLSGTRDADDGLYRVLMTVEGRGEVEIPREEIVRARLVEFKPQKPQKPGKPGKIQGKSGASKKKSKSLSQETHHTTEEKTTATEPPGQTGAELSPSEVATPWQ